jgi:hypothetical protein
MPESLLLVLEHVMIIMIMSVLVGCGGSCGAGLNITWGRGTLHNAEIELRAVPSPALQLEVAFLGASAGAV